jgi:hypothetical protein
LGIILAIKRELALKGIDLTPPNEHSPAQEVVNGAWSFNLIFKK